MSEWISVKDKLPCSKKAVLTYCPENILKIRPCQFDDWEDLKFLGITHWMPLPEPPKCT